MTKNGQYFHQKHFVLLWFLNLELLYKIRCFYSLPTLSNFADASYKHLNKCDHLKTNGLLRSLMLKNGNFRAPKPREMHFYICSADLRRFVNDFQNLKKNLKAVVGFL